MNKKLMGSVPGFPVFPFALLGAASGIWATGPRVATNVGEDAKKFNGAPGD